MPEFKNKIDWESKLTSRKFWMAIVGLISGILLAFKVDAKVVETISGVVLSAGSVVAYIIGEGLTDAARAGSNVPIIVGAADWKPEDFTTEEVSEDVD